MFSTLDLSQLNYLAIGLATIAYFILGYFWYSVPVFGKIWMDALNLKVENMDKSDLPKVMGITFISTFLICFAQAVLLHLISIVNLSAAIKLAVLVGFFFIFLTQYINNLYEKRSMKILFINGGYHFTGLLIATIILVLWK